MVGRWFFLAVVGIGLMVIVHGQRSNASNGAVALTCGATMAEPRDVRAKVEWEAPNVAADQLWFDLGISRDFTAGTWTGHGPLAGDATSYTTDLLAPDVEYFYRVNALHGAQWSAIASGSFTARCPDAASLTATPASLSS